MSAMNDILLNGSIPGEEMTVEFGSRPWHRPPEIEDPVEALDYHLDRMEEPKVRKAILDAIELGIPVRDLNLGMLRTAVSTAVHDLDTMFMIASITHEALELMAEEEGLEFKTGFEETEEDREAEYSLNSMKASKLLEKHKSTGDLEGMTLESPSEPVPEPSMPVDDAEPMIEDNTPVEAPKGLMARKDM